MKEATRSQGMHFMHADTHTMRALCWQFAFVYRGGHIQENCVVRQMIIHSHASRVIDEIAALKGIDRDEVERITAENAIRLFSLPGFETID